jgi:hypothetical protein
MEDRVNKTNRAEMIQERQGMATISNLKAIFEDLYT